MKGGPHGLEPERYRPLTWRRRLLVTLLALATGVVAVLMLTERPGRKPVLRAAPAVCADGRGSDCVGGKATVLVVPPQASAPSAR